MRSLVIPRTLSFSSRFLPLWDLDCCQEQGFLNLHSRTAAFLFGKPSSYLFLGIADKAALQRLLDDDVAAKDALWTITSTMNTSNQAMGYSIQWYPAYRHQFITARETHSTYIQSCSFFAEVHSQHSLSMTKLFYNSSTIWSPLWYQQVLAHYLYAVLLTMSGKWQEDEIQPCWLCGFFGVVAIVLVKESLQTGKIPLLHLPWSTQMLWLHSPSMMNVKIHFWNIQADEIQEHAKVAKQ